MNKSIVSMFKVGEAIVFSRSGVLNAFSTYDIFNMMGLLGVTSL